MVLRMDSRRHERGCEATLHDFALVTTYLPILGLTLRASLLVSVMYWSMYTAHVSFPAVIMLSASIVYLDSLALQSQLDKACGHLCLVALAVLTQQHGRLCSDAETVVLWVSDLLWSVCSSAEVVSVVTTLRSNVPSHIKVLIGCAFASTHVLFNCSAMSMFEMLSRAVLFYVLCSLMILCSPFAPPADRSTCSVLHLCAPVMFVHVYPTLASVLVIVGTHARLVYSSVNKRPLSHSTDSYEPCRPHATSGKASASSSEPQYCDLVNKLQAAKRAHGMV